jgi:hypothetical protein
MRKWREEKEKISTNVADMNPKGDMTGIMTDTSVSSDSEGKEGTKRKETVGAGAGTKKGDIDEKSKQVFQHLKMRIGEMKQQARKLTMKKEENHEMDNQLLFTRR